MCLAESHCLPGSGVLTQCLRYILHQHVTGESGTAQRICPERRLDPLVFEQCLSGGKFQNIVRKSVEEGSRLGVIGTPAFFINDRLLIGVQSMERFVQIIEDELTRVR